VEGEGRICNFSLPFEELNTVIQHCSGQAKLKKRIFRFCQ